MCDLPCNYDRNNCPDSRPIKGHKFTMLLLYCWQREYGKRPYKSFVFHRLDFEARMQRKYHCIRDFHTVVKFLLKRNLLSVSIWSIVVSNWDAHLLKEFAKSLLLVPKIELKLMSLPYEFFVMLRLQAREMKVVHLSLEGTPLSNKSASMLREFLLVNKTLQTLNVSRCNLSPYNFAIVADGVYNSYGIRNFNCSRLVGLTLTLDTEKIASIVGSMLMQNTLVELTMRTCEFVAQDMEIIAEYLKIENCTLLKLDLANNFIGPDGAKILLRAIAQRSDLSCLNISGNSIGSHGGEWVAKYFSSCLMLQYLYITDNQIGAAAINSILLTLKKPTRMKQLHLYGNQYDARTAMVLRRLLDSEVVLQQEIDISYTYDEVLQDYRIIPWL